jgi:exodeoxyribonuclease V beta subunit
MKRFEVLKASTPIFGRFFLEASAGTGKTFAIEHIVVRALLEATHPITIDQILIVTFTRAATRELRLRIKANLLKTFLILQSNQQGPEYLDPIRLGTSAGVFSAKRKVEEALCNFDGASIFTLHGFCYKMLSEYAFQAGTFLDVESPEESSHYQKIYCVVEDFLRAGLTKINFSPAQIQIALKISSKGLDGLCKKIASYVEKELFIPPKEGFFASMHVFQNNLSDIKCRHRISLEGFIDDLKILMPMYKKMRPDHLQQAKDLFTFHERANQYEAFDKIISCKDYFLDLLVQDNLKKGKDPYKLRLSSYDMIQDLIKNILPIIKAASDPQEIFLRLVQECIERWKQSAEYQESFSPDDLVKKMVDAVKNPFFHEKISQKYHVAIIDEFQDTDPHQWDLFKSLFVDSLQEKTIFLVGDPKQSIYAFRNADVYTYLQAMKTLGEENRLFLDTNYRSTPEFVHALNTLFTRRISSSWMQLPSLNQSLDVRAVKAKDVYNLHEHHNDRAAVHFFIAEGNLGRGKKWPTEEVEEEMLFPFIASEVKGLKSSKGYRYGQFAILVRDRFQSQRLELFLKKSGIPCSVKRSFALENSVAYLAFFDVIKAAIAPDDIGALKRVLGGAFISLEASSVLGGMELDCLQEARLYFQQARAMIEAKGWCAFFHDFFNKKWCKKNCSVFEDILSKDDTSLYFEMRQLIQIFQKARTKDLFSVDGFCSFFHDLTKLDADHEILNVPSESEEDEVIVMTIHASKGLEFDVVFALGLACRQTTTEDVIRTKKDGVECLEKYDCNNTLMKRAILETDAEKMRHLYVALTRAKIRVYIPIAIDREQKPIPFSHAAPIELLCQGFGRDEFDFISAYEQIHRFSKKELVEHLSEIAKEASIGFTLIDEEELLKLKDQPPLFNPNDDLILHDPFVPFYPARKVISFSSVQEVLKEVSSKEISTKEDVASDDVIPLGAETGTFLHRILEIVIKESLHFPLQQEAIDLLIAEHAKGTVFSNWHEPLCQMVVDALRCPIQNLSTNFCLLDVPAENFYLEMEFSFEFKGHLLKGFIDAIFKYQNRYYILDWKTNYLGGGKECYDEDSLKTAMDYHGYNLQATIYAEALRRYLPLVEKDDFKNLFGCAIYLFLRGVKAYCFTPDAASLEAITEEQIQDV